MNHRLQRREHEPNGSGDLPGSRYQPKVSAAQRVERAVIMLHSGAELDFLDPCSSGFTIDDVAHGLAHICRYAGQCRKFYSVAEHSLLVSEVCPDQALVALMHDAAEAFVGDVTRPLKQLLPDYKQIEKNVQRAILSRFGISHDTPPQVKIADLAVLAAEQAQIMPPALSQWAREQGIDPAPVRVMYYSPETAKTLFLERFWMLTRSATT